MEIIKIENKKKLSTKKVLILILIGIPLVALSISLIDSYLIYGGRVSWTKFITPNFVEIICLAFGYMLRVSGVGKDLI